MGQDGPKMGSSWGHVGLQNHLGRVQERKKNDTENGTGIKLKNHTPGNHSEATTRSDAESKWPPQGGWGAT